MVATPFDELHTERLIGLRPQHPRDIDAFVELWTDPDVTRHLTGVLDADSAERILLHDIEDWATHGYGVWLFRHRETDELVGRGGLQFTDVKGPADVDVGAILLPKWWKHGFGLEIARAAAEVAFDELGRPSVTAMTDPNNAAALRALTTLGYAREGEAGYRDRTFAFFRLQSPAAKT